MIRKMIRMWEVLKFLKENPSRTLFPTTEYMPVEYSESHLLIDSFLLSKNCEWSSFSFDVESFLEEIKGMFAIHGYKYEKLANTLSLEYNPIENYSMTEEGTDKHTGTVVTDMDFATRKTTNTMDYGEQNSNSDVNMGERTTTNIEQVSPMDRSEYVNRGKNTAIANTVIDTNNQHLSAHTDTSIQVEDARIDTNTDTRDLIDTHKFKRSGNIGVTTSQQMLESERAVANFSFYMAIWEDVVRYLLVRIEGGMFECW